MKRARRSLSFCRSFLRLWFASILLLVGTLAVIGAPPPWWVSRGVLNGRLADDYAVVNQGQLKHIATQAYAEFAQRLGDFPNGIGSMNAPDGTGYRLSQMITQFEAGRLNPTPQTDNAVAVNLGQLKNVAKPFYDRLIEIGFTHQYPWTESTADDDNSALANLGQLKNVFSFDFTSDRDGDGLPDLWELARGFNPDDPSDANADPDYDGLSNIHEFNSGSDPFNIDGDPYIDLPFAVSATRVGHTLVLAGPGGVIPVEQYAWNEFDSFFDASAHRNQYMPYVLRDLTAGDATPFTGNAGQWHWLSPPGNLSVSPSVYGAQLVWSRGSNSVLANFVVEMAVVARSGGIQPWQTLGMVSGSGALTCTYYPTETGARAFRVRATLDSATSAPGNTVLRYCVAGGVSPTEVDGLSIDTDGDGLSDAFEFEIGLDPEAADGDGDGISDATELAAGTDPRMPDVPLPLPPVDDALPFPQMADFPVEFQVVPPKPAVAAAAPCLPRLKRYSATVTWAAAGEGVKAYYLERTLEGPKAGAAGEALFTGLGDWRAIKRISGSQMQYLDRTVLDRRSYQYRVRAIFERTRADGEVEEVSSPASVVRGEIFSGYGVAEYQNVEEGIEIPGNTLSLGGTTVGWMLWTGLGPCDMIALTQLRAVAEGTMTSGSMPLPVIETPSQTPENDRDISFSFAGYTGPQPLAGGGEQLSLVAVTRLVPDLHRPGKMEENRPALEDTGERLLIMSPTPDHLENNQKGLRAGDDGVSKLVVKVGNGQRQGQLTLSVPAGYSLFSATGELILERSLELNNPPANTPLAAACSGGVTLFLKADLGATAGDFVVAITGVTERVSLLPVDIAVDADRNGLIEFGKDTTTAQRPFRFWVNEDDDSAGEDHPSSNQKDYNSNALVSKRDLEDFTRLHVHFGGLEEAIESGAIKVGFEWRDTAGTTPKIKLLRAKTAGLEYLQSESTADSMTVSPFRDVLGEVIPGPPLFMPTGFWTRTSPYGNVPTTLPAARFLLEGGGEGGQGQLILSFWKGNQRIAEGPGVYIKLLSVRKMYERGKVAPPYDEASHIPDPWDNPNPIPLDAVSDAFNWPPDIDPNAEAKTIVFIHGWRMPYREYLTWADSTFKRLWQLGYKGRFYAFRWPTFSGDDDGLPNLEGVLPIVPMPPDGAFTYNPSEYRAWLSGAALANFVNALPNANARYLIAHSMGNVVAGSALLNGMQVTRYAMCNSAMAAMAYNGSIHDYDFETPDTGINAYVRAFGLADKLSAVPTEIVNFGLVPDEALKVWDLNNQLFKPEKTVAAGGKGYNYFPGGLDGHELAYGIQADPGDVFQELRPVTSLSEAMGYVTQSRSKAMGAKEKIGNRVVSFVNMGEGGFEFGVKHSAQWVFSIHKNYPFWKEVLKKFQVDVSNR